MPNHITNHLSFTGVESKVNELLSAVKGTKYDFDIETFSPIPEQLKNTTSPAKIVSEDEYKLWVKRKGKNELTDYELMIVPMTKEISDNLIKKYGVNNWYEWCCANWGTKWGAYDVEKNGDSFEFLSAWSTPMEAMLSLSKLYPEVEIFVRYFDEDFGSNVGEYKLLGGKITFVNQPKDCTEEAYRLAIDIDGSSHYYTDDLLDIDESDNINEAYTATCIKLAHEKGCINNDLPHVVLVRLLEYAVADELYERAAIIKKYIEQSIPNLLRDA